MRIGFWRAAAAGAVLSLAGAGVASAHHSFGAEFDQNAPVTISGDVIKFEWVNPHSWIHIDYVNPKTGQHEHWRIEGGAPSALLRRGWDRNTLKPGTKIIVRAFRARDGDTRASAAEISFPNGTVMSLGNPQTEAAEAAAKKEGK
jgi:hypothetical protein